MQQLVEYDLLVRRLALGQGQHGPEYAADNGAFEPRHLHGPAGAQLILRRDAFYDRRGLPGGLPPAQEQGAQGGVAPGVPQKRERGAGEIGYKQPVREALRRALRPRQGRAQAHRLKGPRIGRAEAQLRGGLRRLKPERELRDYPARERGRDKRPEREHAPDAVLPARRELVAQRPFHKQQRRRGQRDGQRLIEEFPDTAHVTPPSRQAAAGAVRPRRAKCAIPSKTRR